MNRTLHDIKTDPGLQSGFWDNHTHTQLSDGQQSAEEVCRLAASAGWGHLAITDHDVLLPEQDARRLSSLYNINVIPGVELNVSYKINGRKEILHLGILWLPDSEPGIQAILRHNQSQPRELYVKSMLEKLHKLGLDPSGQGVDRSFEMIVERNPHSLYLGKRAVAQLLTDTGLAASRAEAMDKYLGRRGHRLAFVSQAELFDYADMAWVLAVINSLNEKRENRILATLNHPYYYGLEDPEIETLVRDFRRMGGHALEVFYPKHDHSREQKLRGLCAKYGLLENGGSDRHDAGKPFLEGKPEAFEPLMSFHLRRG